MAETKKPEETVLYVAYVHSEVNEFKSGEKKEASRKTYYVVYEIPKSVLPEVQKMDRDLSKNMMVMAGGDQKLQQSAMWQMGRGDDLVELRKTLVTQQLALQHAPNSTPENYERTSARIGEINEASRKIDNLQWGKNSSLFHGGFPKYRTEAVGGNPLQRGQAISREQLDSMKPTLMNPPPSKRKVPSPTTE